MPTDAQILMSLRDGLETIIRSPIDRESKIKLATDLKYQIFKRLVNNGVSALDAEDLMHRVAKEVHASLKPEAV